MRAKRDASLHADYRFDADMTRCPRGGDGRRHSGDRRPGRPPHRETGRAWQTGKLILASSIWPRTFSACSRPTRRIAACRNGSDYLAEGRPQPRKFLPLKLSHPQVNDQLVAQIQWHRTLAARLSSFISVANPLTMRLRHPRLVMSHSITALSDSIFLVGDDGSLAEMTSTADS